MSAVDSLVEMGFLRNRAEKALAVTGNQGIQPAMDWLFAHADDPDIDDPYNPEATGHKLGSGQAPKDESTGQAKSLKCDDCGKLLRSEMEVQAHAARTKHSNFSESTEEIRPLTEEEKAAQLSKLQERMKQKRMDKQELERKETVVQEKQRRKTGKELSEIRHQMELQEAKKIAEERRREKMEERLARQKVRDEIAKDRAERASHEKSLQQQPTQPKAVPTPAKKEYDTCRLQIRLFGGGALVHSFKATDTLEEVNQHILTHSPNVPFVLMTTFPKRVFSDLDTKKTLKELGLVPSSVLIQTQIPS